MSGFSLIELVVVMLLVAILSAIAVPVYTQATVVMAREAAITQLHVVAAAVERLAVSTGDYVHIDAKQLPLRGLGKKSPYQLYFMSKGYAHFQIQAVPTRAQFEKDKGCGTLTLTDENQEFVSGKSSVSACWRD